MVYDPEILGIEGQTPVTWHRGADACHLALLIYYPDMA